MAIARIQLPDGRIATVEIPDGLSVQQAQTLLNQQFAPKAEEPTVGPAGFSLKDTGRVAQQGLYGGLQTLTDLFGAGNAVSKDLSALQQEAAGKLSEERKAEIARRELIKKKAEGNTWEEIKALAGGFAEAPFQTSVGALTGSAPIIASAFLPGGQPAAVAGLTGRAALGARALAAAKSPAAGVGALMGVGGQKGQDYETVKQALLEKNFSEADAERLAQQVSGYSLENAPRQLASGLMGGLEGVTGIEGLLGRAGRLGKALPKVDKAGNLPEPTYGQALRRGILSEAAPEAAQAATGQVGTNIALNQAGIPTDLMSGVAAQVVHDALVGGTLGAATSPLKMREMRQEFVNEEVARKREEDERFAQSRRDAIAQRQKTKQQIVGNQPLLLAGPSQELEPTKEKPPLQNPIGNLTPDELGPEVTSYLNQYRKSNGLPRLQSYSIEDVKDAMTAVNPEGEKAALDSILAAKTGYTGQQNFTAKDVENAAIEKNVATGTKGFSDFLARTTGVNNLQEMSEPQLYAAFTALTDMPANTTGQQMVLPEGTNASRFTQKQYDNAVKFVGMTFDDNNGKPLSTETILADIKDSTNLETDRDAKALLDTAIKNGDLEQSQQVVYRTFKPDTDQMVATYPTRERAAAAAKKQGLNVREATLTQVAPKTPVTPPTAPRAGLPAGYDITERQFKEGEEPEGYQITSEAGGKPFPTILNQAEVEGKIQQLSADRQEIAATKLQEVMKYEDTVNEGKRELEKMEAAGEFDTDAYKQKKARQAAKEDLLGKRIDALYAEIEGLTAKLKSKAVGSKPIARKGYTVTKEGKESGTFPTREAAEESILAGLSDAELDALVSDKKFGGLANRAAAEQNRRRSAPPIKGKKVSEVLKDLESGPPLKETPELLAATKPLRDMLNKFGLGDVALKLVKAIENKADGSYAGKLIQIALDAKYPIRTLRHESLHALKELGFFTDAQWKSLEKMARDKWVDQYLKSSKALLSNGKTVTRYEAYQLPKDQGGQGLTEAEIFEEAIADAFGDFDVNKAPPGMLSALLNKMRGFFESLNNYLEGRGFQNSQDIFGAVEAGKLKAKGTAAPAGTKLSVAPAEEGKPVKEVDPNDVGNIVNNSPYKDAGINVLSSPIVQTSKKLKVDEVGQLFDDAYQAEFGKRGDWRDPNDFKRAVGQAVDELKFQMQQAKSGQDWYDEDIAEAFKATEAIIPSLKDPQKRAFFSVLAGIMSPSTNARENWVIAAEAYQHYEQTGIVPGRNPANGNLWMGGLTSATKEKQLNMLNKMMQPVAQGGMGEKATIEWMQGTHPVKEINQMRRQYGNMGGIDGKATDLKMGLTAFGPKVGPFVMNINGIHEVTVDVWMTRTFNRYFGQMMGPDGKMTEAPTEPQRVAVKNLVISAAQQVNLKPYQVQSVLWFYEQQLFNKLGTGAKSYGFSDGAKKFVETQGAGSGKVPPPTGGGNAPANKPAGQRAGQASAPAGQQPTGKPKKLSLGVVGEVAPNPDHPTAAQWREMTQSERLNATTAVARKVMNGIFDELNLQGYKFKFSTGTYEGEMNPNIIVEAPEDASLEELNELARVMGYALDQKAMVVFDDENTSSENQEGHVMIKVPEGMSEEVFDALRDHIGRAVPQVEGDTLRDGMLYFGNFSAYNDNIETVTDRQYYDAIKDAVATFDYDGDIEIYEPQRFHSELIWPANREAYLEGTRYGASNREEVPAGAEAVRGFGGRRLQTLSEDAIALRDRWIDARGAARLGGRSQPNATSYGEPTAEYGTATPDSTSVTGVHFSKQARTSINSGFYGNGLRGLESERLNDPANSDIRSRAYFYVDTGKGVRPEAGVGGVPHVIQLNNLYDAQKDPLQIVKNVRGTTAEERADRLERGIMNAGFDGYVTRDPIMSQGFAVLIGNHNIKTGQKYSLQEAPDTPEFKRWFGDSKVVDADGKPLVVYHATSDDFDSFDPSQDRRENGLIFFAEDSANAEATRFFDKREATQVMPVYLQIKKMFNGLQGVPKELQNWILSNKNNLKKELNQYEQDWGLALSALDYLDKDDTGNFNPKNYIKAIASGEWQAIEASKSLINKIKELGYDGIKMYEDGNTYAVFKPTQIKSATGNIGTFDATNPDIRYSLRAVEDTPNFKRFFKESKFVDNNGNPLTMYHATNADIVEFNSSEDGKLGAGIYLSSAPDYVTQYAPEGNVMPLYASAQNPYVLNIRSEAVKSTLQSKLPFVNGINKQMEEAVTKLTDGKKRLKDLNGEQVRNLFKRNGYDGIIARDDAGNIIEATVFKPQQVKSAIGNVGTFSPKSKDIRYSLRDATDMFTGKELDKASKTEYKGRYKLVNMPIDDFLKLSKIAGQDAGAQGRADERVQAGTPFTSVPYLYVDPDGTDLRVTGHDGRHRARALKSAGYDTMPVELRSMIRWSEQADPESADYQETWPERIYAEEGALREGASIPMPVTREESPKNYTAPTKKLSVRSVEDRIKALPNGDKMHQAVSSKTTVREEKSIAQRILDAFAGDSIASIRQQAFNRYNQLSVYDKRLADQMGGVELLADSSAEAAALLSDTASGVAAAAFGVNNIGGAPVYRNGVTVVDNFDGKVKGLMDILMPLAELKDPYAYRAFQFYAASKRGTRFDNDGKEKLFDKDDFAHAAALETEFPMFKQVHKDWIAYNDKLVDYMVATGIISKDKAKEFTKYADYIPFYRQLEGQDTIGPRVFQSISGVKTPKKLKGGEAPLADFMETIVRNTQSIIQAGMKNTAGQKAVGVAMQLGDAELLPKQSSAPGTITIMRNGEYESYGVADELFVNSVKSLNMPDVQLWGIFAGPAGLLRSMVTKDPGFMLANLLRDSMSAYVTSGVKMTPVADTVANFGRALGGEDPTYIALVKAGILGGYDYAQGVERSGSQLSADLRKRVGNQSLSERAMDGFGLWSALEKGTSASDAATRMAVYNQVLKDTGNEAEAIFRALEVMNFNRKGANPMIRLLTAAIPFLNARMQGLDIFYRAGIRPSFEQNPTERQKAIQKTFWTRGMYLTSLSVAYWAMTHDDDDYKKQEQETRDNNWLIPSLGVKIPIPFEVGVLFKVIPERMLGYYLGDDTGKDFADSMGRAAWSTFGFLPVPQTALPMLEAATNYSFYTGRNIVGAGMEGVFPEFQKGPSTSKVATLLGEQLGISPMKVDHMIKGYTGTIGTYMVDVIDSIGDLNSESPKAAKRFEQMPVIKRFAVDPEAKGQVTAYYKLKDAVDETVRTINLLERTGRYEELAEYGQKNAKLFASRQYISGMEKQMKQMREAALQVNSSTMSAEEKRATLSAINQAQIKLTEHVQGVKKMLSE
jgi:hypothetical protein